MGLVRQSIQTWADMKEKSPKKYQDYFKSRNACEEVFKISQKEEEAPKDFLNQF